MPKRNTRNFADSFNAVAEKRQNNLQDKLEVAARRIAELETLVGKQTEREVPLDEIEANPNQPRKSFYVVEKMKNLLASQGQKQPIILVKIPERVNYTIFDGECRYRAAKQLNWETIKGVFIPYNSETFQEDVLISALNKSSINALDEAEAIIRRIKTEIELSDLEIIDKLLSFISYTRRRGQLETLSSLTTDYDNRETYIKTLEFRDRAEEIICTTIAHLGRSCISISSNKFPLLKLSPDLREAVRQKGLNERIALRLNAINPNSKKLKGKINEPKALKLRQELLEKIIRNNWSVNAANEVIKNTIQELIGLKKASLGKSYAKYIERIRVEDLTQTERELLLARLRNLISSLENY